MNRLSIGLVGYGNVGAGVVKFLQKEKGYIKNKFRSDFHIKTICDLKFKKNKPTNLGAVTCTTRFQDIISDPEIDIVVELIGGLNPAQEIITAALNNGKHVITANKALIAEQGKSLFLKALQKKKTISFESSVMAGVPVIKSITEGIAGNQFHALYGIINGTCNYILSCMAKKGYTFAQAVKEAKDKGFAETDPTLDINGMDSAYKLAILVSLAFGKFITVQHVHTEGITEISHDDIRYASDLGLAIKLLAIAKKIDNRIEARVHPTLISKEHPLASINGVYNALFTHSEPLGDVLLSGEGAGPMTAASGVVSDLINLGLKLNQEEEAVMPGNICYENRTLRVKKIDDISTRFYIRFTALDKPGVLSKLAGILGRYGIGINSVSQKAHNWAKSVPVIILTDYAREKMVRLALEKISKIPIVKSRPVAIRMEKLP